MDKVLESEIIDPINPIFIPDEPSDFENKTLSRSISLRLAQAMIARANPYREPNGQFGTGPGGAKNGAGVDITSQMADRFGNNGFDVKNPEEISAKENADKKAGKAQSDVQLELIAKEQGFDRKPETVATLTDLLDKQQKEGGTIVHRGLTDYSQNASNAIGDLDNPEISYSAEQGVADFQEGEYYGGWGAFGSGTYATSEISEAINYSQMEELEEGKMGNGLTMSMLIPGNAIMPDRDTVRQTMKEIADNPQFAGQYNLGRALAAKGFQAYDVSFVQSNKFGYTVILDRSMLTVAREVVKSK